MTDQPHRIAVVGIDGSGKSSVVERLRARLGVEGAVVTLSAPLYHQTPNAPLRLLSQQMQAVSVAADRLGLVELKGAILYLQMTLYGVVERCLVDAFHPRCIVSDRHALVDTLAYGPLYRGMFRRDVDGERWGALVRDRLKHESPHALDAAMRWHETATRLSGRDVDFWDLAGDVGSMFDGSTEAVVAELARRCSTQLPDVVVWLDVDPVEALRRARERPRPGSELHEGAAALAHLRELYASALDAIACAWPDILLRRVESAGMTVDETLDAVLDGPAAALVGAG